MKKRVISVNRFCLGEKLLVLVLAFKILSDGVDGNISQQKILEVNKKLKMLNKPAVKSIKSEDGDIIDCVNIYKQPAFDHPALKNHTIQLRPRVNPVKMEKNEHSISQLWQKSGSCPKGTIPIRRIKKRVLLRATSLENYGRKSPTLIGPAYYKDANSSKAYLSASQFEHHVGTADLNVWSPNVAGEDEYSGSQLFIRYDPYDTLESGWMVNPNVYGDQRTRFFVYWTADASRNTGCFDVNCPGFVQTNHDIAIGASLYPMSIRGGDQYYISNAIYSECSGFGNCKWWLQFGYRIIGYWPGHLFKALADGVGYVHWGGEVYSPRIGKIPHTHTQMGSGINDELGFGHESFIRNVRVDNKESSKLAFPVFTDVTVDEEKCYHGRLDKSKNVPEFYYGGAGRSPQCP